MRSIFQLMARKSGIIIICILCVGLGLSLAATFYHYSDRPAAASNGVEDAKNLGEVFVGVADKLSGSVVNITSEKTVEVGGSFPGLDDFFDFGPFGSPPKSEKQAVATGSGVIVRSDGYILTNDHVVGGAERVEVKLVDGRKFEGTVSRDPRTDLALVKIDAKDLPAVGFADSDKVKVGQWAIAIGNPFGFDNTLTVGVVSGISREFSVPNPNSPLGGTYYPDAIQTDAAINSGNSGGPLVDIDGKIIGVNSAIYSRSGGNIGIGFAVPSNTAKFVMEQLIEKGKVVRGFLGIIPTDLTPVLADALGVKAGALVDSVDPGSPAEEGGVEVKDVIVKIDDKDIKSGLDLRRTVAGMAPKTKIDVVVIRDKKEKPLKIVLGEAPNGVEEAEAESGAGKVGLSVQPLTSEIAKQIGVDPDIKGVVVRGVEPGSAGYHAKIRTGDVIIEINDTAITSVASFSKAVNKLKKGQTAIVVVQRGSRSTILELRME